MAIGISTLTTASESLKTYFMPPIIKQLDEGTGPVFKALQKKTQKTVANKFIITLEYGRHGGIGARNELDDLPAAAARFSKQGAVEPKNLFGRIQLSEKLLLGARDDRMSFADELSRQIKNITTDANDMLRRNFCRGSSGVIGTVKTTVSTAAATIAVNGDIGAFYEGQIIDILTPPSAVGVSAAQILNVDRAAGSVTLDRNVTATAGQAITLAGNYGKELTGLAEILSADTTLYGINRAQNKWFNPLVFVKSGDFDSLWMQQAVDAIADNTGDTPKFFVCDRGVIRAYVEEQKTYKNTVEWKTVDGGYKVVEYGGIPVSPEKYFTSGQMAVLTLDNFVLARLGDWHWMDDDGSVLKAVANKAAYEAVLTCYAELLCSKPGANALITGITEA